MNDVPRKRRGAAMAARPACCPPSKSERKYVHPLIFQKMGGRPGERIVPGGLVEVHGVDGEFIGRGMLNMQAPMAIRLLSEKPDEVIDAHWLAEKVADAVRLRRDIYRLDAVTDSYRVIHAGATGSRA